MATICKLPKILWLSCRITIHKWGSFSKVTWQFREPANELPPHDGLLYSILIDFWISYEAEWFIFFIWYEWYFCFRNDQRNCSKRSLQHSLQHTVTHCNTLHHTASHCNRLQQIATQCSTLQHASRKIKHTKICKHSLQHNATHCNTLQHTATQCNAL